MIAMASEPVVTVPLTRHDGFSPKQARQPNLRGVVQNFNAFCVEMRRLDMTCDDVM
jgi:hypothetical protein